MYDFRDIVAVTGTYEGNKFFTLVSESGDIVIVYDDNTCHIYHPEQLEELKKKVENAKIERIYCSHKDYSLDIVDAAFHRNEIEDIIKKLDFIKNFIKNIQVTEDYNIDTSNMVIKNIDTLGRITIPKNIRRNFELLDGGAARVYENNCKIIIEPIK